MNDLISREAACQQMDNLFEEDLEAYGADIPECFDSDRAIEALMELPSAEPVIRCKDCKHYNAGYECLIEGYGIERDKDWFCADAERKEDE